VAHGEDCLKKWGHDELQHDLAEYLRNTRELIAWENMQLGPSGSPRPDVYALPRSYSNFRPIAYECKISVADFRSDITSGKWQSYLKFSCGVVFAAPAGLISKDDLPKGCGLIQRSESGWRMLKGPTLQRLPDMNTYTWIKLLIDGVERDAKRARTKARERAGAWQIEDRLRAKYGAEVARLVGLALRAKEQLAQQTAVHEATVRAIKESTSKASKEAREQAEREARYVTREMEGLAVALGLPANASSWELQLAIREARDRLGIDGEVQRLRKLLHDIGVTIRTAEKPLPGEIAANDNEVAA